MPSLRAIPTSKIRYRDLFRALRDSDSLRRDTAYDAILFDREQAVPYVIAHYRESEREPAVRTILVQLLGFSGSTAALAGILEALLDAAPEVRAEACRAIEDLGSREAEQALRERLEDLDAEVRAAAREALEGLGLAA